jgi:hypothetical protein
MRPNLLRVKGLGVGRSAAIVGAVAGALWGGASAAHAQCVDLPLAINGSFESPVIANNSVQAAICPPWQSTAAIDSPIFLFRGSVGPIWPLAHSGSQFADIGNNDTFVSHSFNVPHNALVTVTWYENAAITANSSPYSVFLRSRDVIEGWQLVASPILDAANAGVWQAQSLTGVLPEGPATLSFAARGFVGGFDTLIDSVTLTINPQPFAIRGSLLNFTAIELRRDRSFTLSPYEYRLGGKDVSVVWQQRVGESTWVSLPAGVVPIPGFGTVSGANTFLPTFTGTVLGATAVFRPLLSGPCFTIDGLPITFVVDQCDGIDFNDDGLFPDDQDLVDFLAVLAGGPCTNDPNCNDIDFNNDGLFPDDNDLITFLRVLAGGRC